MKRREMLEMISSACAGASVNASVSAIDADKPPLLFVVKVQGKASRETVERIRLSLDPIVDQIAVRIGYRIPVAVTTEGTSIDAVVVHRSNE